MSWRTTLPCTRHQAEAIDAAADLLAGAVVTASEVAPDRWQLDAYTEMRPEPALLAALAALAPGAEPEVAELGDEDWVAMSQAGLEPIREGRFAVHTPAHPADPPPGGRAFVIDAGRAFGTGHHATTSGCLALLDTLEREGRRFGSVLDIGTGTGLLAFAARELWSGATVLGTDIDAVAVEVARENMAANAITGVDLAVADGARGLPVAAGTRFDLVIANILAGPLRAMAPEIAGVAASGGAILLSGLLTEQAEGVLRAYVACGCRPVRHQTRGEWSVLLLDAGAVPFVHNPSDDAAERDGWALDL